MNQTEQSPKNPRLILSEEFRARLGGMSRTTHSRHVKSGELPAPIFIGGKGFYEEGTAVEVIARKRAEADARQAEALKEFTEAHK